MVKEFLILSLQCLSLTINSIFSLWESWVFLFLFLSFSFFYLFCFFWGGGREMLSHCVSKTGLELHQQLFWLGLPRARITGVHHYTQQDSLYFYLITEIIFWLCREFRFYHRLLSQHLKKTLFVSGLHCFWDLCSNSISFPVHLTQSLSTYFARISPSSGISHDSSLLMVFSLCACSVQWTVSCSYSTSYCD